MYSGRINYEFAGSVNKEWIWKGMYLMIFNEGIDNLYYFHSLKVKSELCYHSGCVSLLSSPTSYFRLILSAGMIAGSIFCRVQMTDVSLLLTLFHRFILLAVLV